MDGILRSVLMAFGMAWPVDLGSTVSKFVPFVLFLEVPLYLLILVGVLRHFLREGRDNSGGPRRHPPVSCIVTCYNEGRDVQLTVASLTEQLYPGTIEILVVVDGADANRSTYEAARELMPYVAATPNRSLHVLPKWQRGGRVSSLNLGLSLCTGEIVMALDGDTSFDNDMVANGVRRFEEPGVVGVAGSLRARNWRANLITRLQGLEYLLSIHLGKTGLSEFNVVNNISGAFGIFRRDFLTAIGGWKNGTAEDLDLTLRMKSYAGRYPGLRIPFEPRCVGHTDVPATLGAFLRQRLRWDGDLSFIYFRRFRKCFRPGIVGWKNLLMLTWSGVFLQVVMPFIIVLYYAWAIVTLPFPRFLSLQILIYCFYLAVSVGGYMLCLALLSERPREDLKLLPCLPLLPFFAFATRLWNAYSTVQELTLKAHQDSSMAPWWVLRKDGT